MLRNRDGGLNHIYFLLFFLLILQNEGSISPPFNSNGGPIPQEQFFRSSNQALQDDSIEVNEGSNGQIRSISSSVKTPKNPNEMSEYWSNLRENSSSFNISDKGSLIQAARSLGSLFNKLVDVELGVRESEELYNSLPVEVKRLKSLKERAGDVADKFSGQLRDYSEALERMKHSVKRSAEEYQINNSSGLSLPFCCEINPESLRIDEYFKTPIERRGACKTLASSNPMRNIFTPDYRFGQVLVENSDRFPHLKWQYFVSPEGSQVEYPANKHNCKQTTSPIRENSPTPNTKSFSSSVKKLWMIQKSKEESRNHRIVFLLQIGPNTITSSAIKSIKNIVLLLLRFLDEAVDKVGILNVEGDGFASDFFCDQLVPVTAWTRYQIMHYIEQRFKEPSYNPTPPPLGNLNGTIQGGQEVEQKDPLDGIQRAINMACANYSSESPAFPPSAATIIHLTTQSILTPLRRISVECPVFIDTFILRTLNTSEEDSYKSSLQSIASKNIWRVQVFSSSSLTDPEAFAFKVALKLNSKKEWWSLSDILSQFFPKENEKSSQSTDFSFPHWNSLTKEAVVIAKQYVFHQGRPLGIVAIEIPLTYFTQHVTYFVDENVCDGKNYAFLIDKTGRVIAHPALGRPEISEQILTPIQIESVEIHRGFGSLKRRLLGEDSGCFSLSTGKEKRLITYAWSQAGSFEYVVVLVFHGASGGCNEDKEGLELKRVPFSLQTQLAHHQLLKGTHLCGNQIISVNKTALYLSPSAFSKPADSLGPQSVSLYKTKQYMGLMAFIGDNSGFVQQNRGLKSTVKNHIGALAASISNWNWRFFNSDWNKYILRRFGAGGGGTFLLVHPGMQITNGYMPSSAQWFREALKTEGIVAFSRPKIDQVSPVPFSTISKAVRVQETGPNPSSIPIAVFGMDVNIGFFQKLLEELMPQCSSNDTFQTPFPTRCFLMDNEGYIIYHPHLPTSLKTLSQVHVTQLEALTIIDVVQHGSVPTTTKQIPMKKHICHKLSEASSTQGSLQRFYTMSMNPEIVVQNLKHGEQCSRYSIVPISGTNILLAIVHDTCSSATAFCPCSTIDNLCLNCLRMEPLDFQENFCECPCECPREPSFCLPNGLSDLADKIEPCEFPTEPISMPFVSDQLCDKDTPRSKGCLKGSCETIRPSCNSILNKSECIGAFDCHWCSSESSETYSCFTFEECYGYAYGSSIYNTRDNLLFQSEESGLESFEGGDREGDFDDGEGEGNGTIIPVLAVLSMFVIFLGFVVYCYRQRGLVPSASAPELHLLPLQESPLCSIVPQAGSSQSRSDSDSEEDGAVPLPIVVGGSYGRERRRLHGRMIAQPPPRSPLGSATGTDDSETGYSTMQDMSECGPFRPIHIKPSPAPPTGREPPNCISISPEPTTHIGPLEVPITVHKESFPTS